MEWRISTWFKSMGTAIEMACVHALRQLQDLDWSYQWALCAGTGIACKFYTGLANVLRGAYDIELQFGCRVFCDMKKDRQHFLRSQHSELSSGHAMLVQTLKELSADKAHDLMSPAGSSKQLLPYMHWVDAGIPCHSVVSNNMHAAENVGCVQRGESSTGIAWAEIDKAISVQGPAGGQFECSDRLNRQDVELVETDGKHILKTLVGRFGWAIMDSSDAKSWGSYPGRWRAYWGALALHRELPHELPACVFHRILTAMKNPERPASATDCITICDAARECEAKQLGLPRHQDFGICRDKRGGKESAK